MNRFFTIVIIVIAVVCTAMHSEAQVGKVDARRETNFILEVKILDEFIDRFNNEPTPEFKKAYMQSGKRKPLKRRDLIRSLFEFPAGSVDSVAKRFIAQVTDSLYPQKLSFYDSGWYAEVQCAFKSGGQQKIIPLILQVNANDRQSVRWMIAGIGESSLLNQNPKPRTQKTYSRKNAPTGAIPSSDYGTNFLELYHILTPGIDADNVLLPELLDTKEGKTFVQLLKSGQLTLLYPGKMKFHFFQIQGYVFTVERFVRDTNHSGWLISSLLSLTEKEKSLRRQMLLQRPL